MELGSRGKLEAQPGLDKKFRNGFFLELKKQKNKKLQNWIKIKIGSFWGKKAIQLYTPTLRVTTPSRRQLQTHSPSTRYSRPLPPAQCCRPP